MFLANIKDEHLWKPVLTHPVFISSLEWIKTHGNKKENGIYNLEQEGWYVNVHAYETKLEENCRWENHTKTIDVQYIINGAEQIRWCSANELGSITEYNESTDTQRFELKHTEANLFTLTNGMFVVFLPGDAHCPQIAPSKPSLLKKLVVKIPLHLVQ